MLRVVAKHYLHLYGIPYLDFFDYLPTLAYVESLIYQADEEIENGYTGVCKFDGEKPFERSGNLIEELLADLGVFDNAMEALLKQGMEYYKIENAAMRQGVCAESDVRKVFRLRTFDLRLLHRTLVKLSGRTYDERLFEALSYVEMHIDIQDDLVQYQQDFQSGKFNTFLKLESVSRDVAIDVFTQEIVSLGSKIQSTNGLTTVHKACIESLWNDYPLPALPVRNPGSP